ncbi:MAG: hydrogenase/urease maturation nickel metallochaperone HypA [Nanoarchaeota archaeon]
MHEILFAQELLNQIENKDNVQSIELEVGELAEITAEELRNVIEDLMGWEVIVENVLANVECGCCGFTGRPKITERNQDFVIYECPQCKGLPRAKAGKEIIIKKIIYFD